MTKSKVEIAGRYRTEIDGLRAFAVVAVIINHFNKDILPSGYLGVDIFFVISGYVITSSLAGRKSINFWDFLSGFYSRRFKRLLPALITFTLITGVLILSVNPNPIQAITTGILSLFGLSNIYLANGSTDYFAQSTELNPFLHTWSLGVEEQFYILFPFLIWFSGFGRQTQNGARNLFLTVSALTITSLIGFLYLYSKNQPAAYFLMPSRFWEMAVGCLIFIGFQKRASIEKFLEKVPPLLVLALIVFVMYQPIWLSAVSTIAVVALTSVLIASLKEKTTAFKIFTNPKIVYIGLISYSLYLWHWSVISISRWTIGIHWWSIPFQVTLIFFISIASYRWIELPSRHAKNIKSYMVISFGIPSAILASSILFILYKQRSNLLIVLKHDKHPDFVQLNINSNKIKKDQLLFDCWSNHKSNKNKVILEQGSFSKTFLDSCLIKGGNNKFLIFTGDSHNHSWINAKKQYNALGFTTFFHSKSGCLFPLPKTNSRSPKDCPQFSKATVGLIDSLLGEYSNGAVIINFYLQGHFHKEGHMNPKEINDNSYLNFYIKELSVLAQRFPRLNLILITTKPDHEYYSGEHDEENIRCGQPFLFLPRGIRSAQKCNGGKYFTPQNHIESETYPIVLKLQAKLSDYKNIYILDTLPALCSEGKCYLFHEGNALYSDSNHLSVYGVKKVDNEILRPVIFSSSN